MDQFSDQAPNPLDFEGPVVRWWLPLHEPMYIDTSEEITHVIRRHADELAAQSKDIRPTDVWVVVRIRFHKSPAAWAPSAQEMHAFSLAKNQLWEPLTQPDCEDGLPDLLHFVAELEITFHQDSPPDDYERSRAFEAALQKLQEIQDQYALITRTAPPRITLESVPAVIPVETEAAREPPRKDLYSPNLNLPGLGDEVETEVPASLLKQVEFQVGGAFWGYHTHRKDALVALLREGDYNKALISAATAAELLLDELLRGLLWEANWDPERAAGQFFSGNDNSTTSKRLRHHYSGLLDYDWDPDSSETLKRWRLALAGPRNWALHNGSRAPRAIAEEGIEALLELDAMIGSRLAESVDNFPRVAHLLLGVDGLNKMGAWSQELHDSVSSEREVEWHPTFARWRDVAVRATGKLEGLEPAPELDRALLHIVFQPHRQRWVLYDDLSDYAIPVKEQPTYLTEEQQEFLEHLSEEPVPHGTVIAFFGHGPRKWIKRGNGWQRPYKLLPTKGVMRDGSDSVNKFT